MVHRHPARNPMLPTLWLMTDERQGDALWLALAALPRGSGVVFRHHRTPEPQRSAILAKVARVAARRGLVLAREAVEAQSVQVLLPAAHSRSSWIARVRTLRDAVAARRSGALAVFVSPLFPTRTHPDAHALGSCHAAALVRATRLPAIALGGMTVQRFRQVEPLGFYGWAAIDGLTPRDQKRKAVPT